MDKEISFQEYLKRYTTISNKFINDFCGLYNVKTTNNDFIINLDKIASWLGSLKKHIKKTLIETYQENIDYKIKLMPPSGRGRPSEEIMLTSSCAKRISMMSRTPNAEQVREYFLQLEAHLDKYKNHIINALNKQISGYKKELKPQEEIPTTGAIYVLKTTEELEDVYKIGRTQNFKERLKTHQSSHPDKIEIAFVYETENIEQVEGCLKDALKSKGYRKRKEFYEVDGDILKELIVQCDCMHLRLRKKTKNIKYANCRYIIHIAKNMMESGQNKKVLLDKL